MRRLMLAVALVVAGSFVAHAADPYRLIKEIPIGGEGGWDYVTVDQAANRLYVSHATKVIVVDIDRGVVVAEIPDTEGVHGFAIAHLDDPNTLTVVQTLPTLVSGRTMILDPVSHHIFVPAAMTTPTPAAPERSQPVTGTFTVLMYGMP